MSINRKLRYRIIDNPDVIGEFNFTFDGEKIYSMWKDYPYNLTEEEVKLFDEAEPYWADFFKDRKLEK